MWKTLGRKNFDVVRQRAICRKDRGKCRGKGVDWSRKPVSCVRELCGRRWRSRERRRHERHRGPSHETGRERLANWCRSVVRRSRRCVDCSQLVGPGPAPPDATSQASVQCSRRRRRAMGWPSAASFASCRRIRKGGRRIRRCIQRYRSPVERVRRRSFPHGDMSEHSETRRARPDACEAKEDPS